eukprot:889373-Prymnesium_polylepis.1
MTTRTPYAQRPSSTVVSVIMAYVRTTLTPAARMRAASWLRLSGAPPSSSERPSTVATGKRTPHAPGSGDGNGVFFSDVAASGVDAFCSASVGDAHSSQANSACRARRRRCAGCGIARRRAVDTKQARLCISNWARCNLP